MNLGFTYSLKPETLPVYAEQITLKINDILKQSFRYKQNNMYLTGDFYMGTLASAALSLRNELQPFKDYIESANLFEIGGSISIKNYL